MLLLDVLDAMPKHSREKLVGTVLRSSSTLCVVPSCVIVMIPSIITYPQSFSLLFFLVPCITWTQKYPSPICNLPVAWLPGFFFSSPPSHATVLYWKQEHRRGLSYLFSHFSCYSTYSYYYYSYHFFVQVHCIFFHLLTLLSAIPTTSHPISHIIATTSTFNTPAPSLSFCLFLGECALSLF